MLQERSARYRARRSNDLLKVKRHEDAEAAVGATVTYRHYGTTRNGIPRFASFLRVRAGH